jgi:gluconolactonase
MEAFRSFFDYIGGEIKRLAPSVNPVERVASGFRFTEGPVWIAEEECLLFSDIPASQILKLKKDGQVVVFRAPSGNANGLTCDREGRLIVCEQGNRRVTRTERDGSLSVVADRYQGKRLNSPNDLVVKSDGGIYFTDPHYGIEPCQREQPVQGVYFLPPDGSELRLVAGDFEMPNGLAFSPDERTLYIDDSAPERRHVRVFRVEEDGSLSNGRLFHDMNSRKPGDPDGMKVDVCGNIYCAGAGGVWIFSPQGGLLGTIKTPETPSNCAWGDGDLQSLYITARTSVYRVRVNIPGMKLIADPAGSSNLPV